MFNEPSDRLVQHLTVTERKVWPLFWHIFVSSFAKLTRKEIGSLVLLQCESNMLEGAKIQETMKKGKGGVDVHYLVFCMTAFDGL